MADKLSLTPEVREFFRLAGRKGGKRCNPFKGFGTRDNARKAALSRWAKVKKAK